MLDYDTIKTAATKAGFDLCGIAKRVYFQEDELFFREWVAAGYASSLGYLSRNLDKRFDVAQLVCGARTVVVCAVRYGNGVAMCAGKDVAKGARQGGEDVASEGAAVADRDMVAAMESCGGGGDGCPTKIASYACTDDYHTTIKAMLRQMTEELLCHYPQLSGRIFTDSAPLLEKRYAVEAGLGWIGRQSLLVTPQYGTFVLLGEIVLCDDCNRYDKPLQGGGCGECRRCVEACPNGAIFDRHIDTAKCISCATVERDDEELPLHGWIFGCDECQIVCPYNRRTPVSPNPHFMPHLSPADLSVERWLSMSDEEFERRMGKTPLARSGLLRLQRNARRNASAEKTDKE